MSGLSIVDRPAAALAVTAEQIDLIKRTVAKDATADELKLYLFDCQRQGVHPLDKLVHFTKRSGKYTPITSIDFMRIRAAETDEYAGSDVPLLAGKDGIWTSLWLSTTEPPLAAMVTVWRLVQGTRCKFEAVARWAEYKPDQNDFMWKKMPATMLAKCAEACALRKGFPRQLAGLYAKEELDQAGAAESGYTVDAPAPTQPVAIPVASEPERAQTAGAGGEPPETSAPLPDGTCLVSHVQTRATGAIKAVVQFTNNSGKFGDGFAVYQDNLAALAEQCCQNRIPVRPIFKVSGTSKKEYLKELIHADQAQVSVDHEGPIGGDEVPF